VTEFDKNKIIVKLIGAIVLTGIGTTVAILGRDSYLSTSDTVDQGLRPLVVVASSGGDRSYGLNVRMDVQDDKSLRMTFYFTAKGITYREKPASSVISARVSFAGARNDDGLRCGTAINALPQVPFAALSPGTQQAIKIDAEGGTNSALNYGRESNQPQVGKDVMHGAYREYRTDIHILNDGSAYENRTVGEDEVTVWADVCMLPKTAVWRTNNSSYFGTNPRRTLLIPQVDWTSIGKTTDRQSWLYETVHVPRTQGEQLSESYPQMHAGTSEWTYVGEAYWAGSRGGKANIGYTDQPVFIFSSRSAADARAFALVVLGLILGVIGSLVVYIASRSVDLVMYAIRGKS